MPAKSKARTPQLQHPNTHTLSTFLEENFRLVSVFGVLIAISSFAANLALRALGIAFSFLFLVSALLVWLELWRKFPWRGSHWILLLFSISISLTGVVIILYWLVFFREFVDVILAALITALILIFFAGSARRVGLFEKTLWSRSVVGRIGRLLITMVGALTAGIVSIILAISISRMLAPPLFNLLEKIYESLQVVARQSMTH